MAVRLNKASTGARVKMGKAILSAARGVDTRLVKERLQRFEEVHRTYLGVQKKVDAAEAQLTAAQAVVSNLCTAQDEAVEALAVALINEGQPRRNPFEVYGTFTASGLAKLPFAGRATAVHEIVKIVVRARGVTEATIKAAQAADEAARAVEQALLPIDKLEDNVRQARTHRDAVGSDWDTALASLRGLARIAGREGAPGLHGALFKAVTRTGPRAKPPAETPSTDNGTPTGESNAA